MTNTLQDHPSHGSLSTIHWHHQRHSDVPIWKASGHRRQKCDMRQNRVAQALLSRNAVLNILAQLGEQMAIILMIPVGPVTTLNRSILLTERRMSGTGGDDFICGHCGHVMLEDFDLSTIRGNPVYQCGVCENNNDLPFAVGDGRHWPSR